MLRRFRARLTYANVMVTILVFIVLGGGAYAAFHLPKNSVRSRNIVNGQVKKADLARTLTSPATIHRVNRPGEPQFQNGWKNEGSDVAPVSFFRNREGVVHITGTISPQTSGTGAGTVIFTLPPGYRPAVTEEFPGLIVNSGPTRIINQVEVQDTGVVVSSLDVGDEASLSGITFRCGPAGKNGCP